MDGLAEKKSFIGKLQKEILSFQGYSKPLSLQKVHFGLGPIENSFPSRTFPVGAIHEFISDTPEGQAATSGFMSGLLSVLTKQQGKCLWISQRRTVFPPSLAIFGIEPDCIVFIDLARQKDLLWAIEEALKCESLSAVVGEIQELSFTESRRLQLATEKSRVTGFIHRYQPKKKNPVACVASWKIKPLVTEEGDMPGLGLPKWLVELSKVRNGKTGGWEVQWKDSRFDLPAQDIPVIDIQRRRKTG